MSRLFSKGVIALFATTALSQPLVWAQDVDSAVTSDAPDGDELRQSTIVIRGEFIPEEKRETSEVSSLLDASDFAVQGDSDVAGALKRVTGVSIADGKFLIVRGLNERYSSSTLNGSPLPSPEPLRRVAPLDLFPTAILESTVVQKTFSPEQSGEFGGGSVDIRTKSVPDAPFFEVGFSVSGDTATTFKDGFSYKGGDRDVVAMDNGVRDLPAGLESVLSNGGYDDLTAEEQNAFSKDLTANSELYVLQEGFIGPDVKFNATGGTSFEVGNGTYLGVLASASYGNEWSTREAQRAYENLNESVGVNYDSYKTTNTTSWNALGAVGLDFLDTHEVQVTGFLTRSSDKEARLDDATGSRQRISFDFEEPSVRDSLKWIERELWTVQARGEHLFTNLSDFQANWRASRSTAKREAPFGVENFYVWTGDELRVSPTRGAVRFSDINEDTSDAAIDLLLPLYFGDVTFDIKAGASHVQKERNTRSYEFKLDNLGLGPAGLRIDQYYDSIFADVDIAFDERGGDGLPSVSDGELKVDALYAGFDTQLTPFLRAAFGGRMEDGEQKLAVKSFLTDPTSVSVPDIKENDFLPAATLTWNFVEDLQLRVGYSETLTRPQFRELSPTLFTNTDTDQVFFGNPFLTNSALTNYDARMEYYFGRDQFVTVGLFYKNIDKPIEEIDSGRETPTTTFVNSPSAELQGFELEYEQSIPLDQWVSWGWFGSKNFTVKTNYTYTDSKVNASEGETILRYSPSFGGSSDTFDPVTQSIENVASGFIEDGRPLQGQSENLFNFQFGFSDYDANSDANFLVNYASERIRAAGQLGAVPDTMEKPPILVDFVYNRTFDFVGGEYKFGLKIQNLLNEGYEAFQETNVGTVIVDGYDLGQSVSVSIKKTF